MEVVAMNIPIRWTTVPGAFIVGAFSGWLAAPGEPVVAAIAGIILAALELYRKFRFM